MSDLIKWLDRTFPGVEYNNSTDLIIFRPIPIKNIWDSSSSLNITDVYVHDTNHLNGASLSDDEYNAVNLAINMLSNNITDYSKKLLIDGETIYILINNNKAYTISFFIRKKGQKHYLLCKIY